MATILNHHPSFVFFLLFLLLIKSVATNDQIANITNATNYPPPPPPPHIINSFKPGIAVIVGISTTIFSATFLLLLYLKHCKRTPPLSPRTNNHTTAAYYANQRAAWRTNSGLNRKLIGSLPTFRFSSLRGQKEGLECAVCLNRFEPEEILRLLPKCKHAFHVECVDTWLDAHSTCPLCRYRVDPEDVLLLDNFTTTITEQSDYCCDNEKSEELALKNYNPRVSGRHSEKSVVEMIVEKKRVDFDRKRSSLDGWINYSKRKLRQPNELQHKLGENQNQNRKDGELPVKEKHKLDHRIIIGRRWSDAQVKEYLYLESENLIGIGMRSMSEMTKVSRYSTTGGNTNREEEKIGNRWLAWISQSKQHTNTDAIVQQQPNIATLSSSSSGSIVV